MKRWLVLGLLVCACGSNDSNNNNAGGSSASGSITGTVGGRPLSVNDAVFAIANNAVLILVADRGNVCSLLGGTTLPGTTTGLLLSIVNFVPPATLSPPVIGDYAFFDLGGGSAPTTAGQYWYGEFDVVDTSCAATASYRATGGTLTVTQTGDTSGTHFKANLTGFQFGTDTLNGNLEATFCPTLTSNSCGALIARPSGFAAQ